MSNYFEPFVTCEIRSNNITNENEIYIVYANELFCTMFGIAYGDAAGKNLSDVCHDTRTSIFDWPSIIINAATTNEYKIIEQYFDFLNKYLKLFIFGYNDGVFDMIIQDITERKQHSRILHEKDRQIEYLLKDLRIKNNMDNVTKLNNFQFVMDSLEESIRSYHEENVNFSMLLIDFINFKSLNLKYGSKFADGLLAEVAECIIANTRKIDLSCRYLGDKFLIVYNDIDTDIAKILIDRLKNNLKKVIMLYGELEIPFNGAIIDYSGQKKEELIVELEEKVKKSKLLGYDVIL